MTGSAVEREAAYYQTIEEFFVARRGEPLTISNADWLLVRSWRLAGIPLRVALRGIQDALEAHAYSFSRARKVAHLRYCAAEVEAAHERWRRALGGGEDEAELQARLLELARLLERSAGRAAAVGERTAAIAAELRRRSAAGETRGGLEAFLAAAERALLDHLRLLSGPDALARFESEVEADLAPYRERLPARVLDSLRRESLARRLLETYGLPRLTLVEG